MSVNDQIIARYAEAYQQLYNRQPKDLRLIDDEWVIVNGARMRVRELEYLTEQLKLEYAHVRSTQRGLVERLVKWLKRL